MERHYCERAKKAYFKRYGVKDTDNPYCEMVEHNGLKYIVVSGTSATATYLITKQDGLRFRKTPLPESEE